MGHEVGSAREVAAAVGVGFVPELGNKGTTLRPRWTGMPAYLFFDCLASGIS